MRQGFLRLSSLMLLSFLLASCSGSGNGSVDRVDRGNSSGQAPQGLPDLAGLDQLDPTLTRDASSTQVNLLAGQPIDSNTGTPAPPFPAPAEVALDPAAAGGMAWAIYGLAGFPNDGSILPILLSADSDGPIWVGLADFNKGSWDFNFGEWEGPNASAISDGQRLISPGGRVYVAVVAAGEAVTVTNLSILTNADVPGDPTVVLNVLTPEPLLEGFPVEFSAAGSTPGSGTFYSFEYDFGDIAGNDSIVVTTPDEVVQWTYLFGDTFTVTLTVRMADGRTVVVTQEIVVQTQLREVLVVYNANIQEDVDLAEYYAAHDTGRFVNEDYMLGLDLADAENFSETIERATFETDILTPIRDFLNDPFNSVIKQRTKYILLMKGIPHRINDFLIEPDEEFTSASRFASVDSELCTLYSYDEIPKEGWVVNGPSDIVNDLFQFDDDVHLLRQFYLAGDSEFDNEDFDVTDGATVWPLDYLVGRITGYTYDDARAIIDRSKAADTSGAGWIVFDSSDGDFGGDPQSALDTMVDQVWPYVGDIDSGQDLLVNAGFNVFADVTTEFIVTGSLSLPPEFDGNVLGYAGWGVNHAEPPPGPSSEYILNDLGWTYVPGALFMSYESFNGTDFDDSDGIARRGQGQIADFISEGGTVAIGNAWEPFTIGVGDERWVFDRYINHGDRWIEAAYKGLRLLSWQNVVVGDPYCRVVADE